MRCDAGTLLEGRPPGLPLVAALPGPAGSKLCLGRPAYLPPDALPGGVVRPLVDWGGGALLCLTIATAPVSRGLEIGRAHV